MDKKSFLENVIDKYNWYNEVDAKWGLGTTVTKIRVEDDSEECEEYDSIEEFCEEWANADIDYYDYDIGNRDEGDDFVLFVKLWFDLF